MKIGLYFGSFNPIHIGHLLIAQALLNQSDCKRVWFVVSPQNPFKEKKSLLNEVERLRMVELATEDNPAMEASNLEFHLPRPSYTIDTLNHLKERYKTYQFSLLMGGDNLTHLPKWKNYEDIVKQYTIFVYPRPGESLPEQLHQNICPIDAPLMDVSSTKIREMIRQGQSVRYLTPDPVYQYLQNRRYYVH